MERPGRVRQLNLTLGVPPLPAPELAEIRRLTEERFLSGVLDACEAAVRRALGTAALLHLRRLEVRWQVRRDELDSPAAQERLGGELGEALLAQVQALPREQRLRPRSRAPLAVFESEAHLRAAHLSATVDGEGEDAWFFAGLRDEAGPWSGACAAGAEVLGEVMGWLEAMGTAPALLARMTEEETAMVEALLPRERWPGARRGPDHSGPSASENAGEAAPAMGALASLTAPGRDGPGPLAADTAALSAVPPRAPGSTSRDAIAGRPVASEEVAALPTTVDGDAPGARPSAPPGLVETAVETPLPAAALPEIAPALLTQAAGVFYLARPILELDLAEHLYCAGLLEGRVIAHALALLVASPDDPAPWVLGGALDGEPPPLPAAAEWAAREVWDRGRAALAGRLRARELPCPLDEDLAEALDGLAAPLIPRTHDPVTALLLARCAALVAWFFLARLDRPAELEPLRTLLAVEGRLEIGEEELLVAMPMAAVDLELRRAGLDFDPGWIPWLRLQVRLAFGDGRER
jgi:hypothetical protein